MDHVHVMADLDPVGFLRIAPQCTNAPYRLQVFQSQATAQLVDQAQTLQTTLQLRDEQMHEAGAELADMGARIGTLEGQVQELQAAIGERNAKHNFLGDQLYDLQLDLDDSNAQLHQQQHALHVPPDEMQVDGEEEPQEMEGISDVDIEEHDPQPALIVPHSPAESIASVHN